MTQQIALLTEDKMDLLRDTICKGATKAEFELFVHACNRTGLDPFLKQIHAVKRWNSKLGREEMTIQTGIDGFRLIADRTEGYAPGKEPSYIYDENRKVVAATSYVKKMTKDGTWHEVGATAHWSEYCPTPSKDGKISSFWVKMPHVMLAKCAEALALRKAFPANFSGLYTKEEMAQSGYQPDDDESDILVSQPTPDIRVSQPEVDTSSQPITKIKAEYLLKLIGQNLAIKGTVDKVLASCGFKTIYEVTNKEFERFEKGIMELKKETEVKS